MNLTRPGRRLAACAAVTVDPACSRKVSTGLAGRRAARATSVARSPHARGGLDRRSGQVDASAPTDRDRLGWAAAAGVVAGAASAVMAG